MLIASFLDLTCNTLYFDMLVDTGNKQSLMKKRVGLKPSSRLKDVSEAINLVINSVSCQSYLNGTFKLKIDYMCDEPL